MRTRRMSLRLALASAAVGLTALAPLAAANEHRFIVGGSPASQGEYPWMAALYNLTPSSGQFCGGTLVEPTYVVTAAHCTPFVVPGVTRVLLGRNSLSGNGGQQITVLSHAVHPLYNAVTNEYDVAVLRLASAASYQPLPYARPGQEALWAPGATATVIGWGLTKEDGDPSDSLLEADVPVVDDGACDKAYGGWITPSLHVCAGNMTRGGVDTCQGDSGGPLMVKNGATYLLAGITSFGEGCARKGKPGVYTEVAAVAAFVDLATV